MDHDEQLHDEINDLVAEGLLEHGTPAHGMAKQVIDGGFDSLTATQMSVWYADVGPKLAKRKEQLEWQRRAGKGD